jgi:NCS1 family nucleobase:cation symporter-1
MGISLTGTNAINVYTGALSALSGVATFGNFTFRAIHRIVACIAVLAAGLISALLGYHTFLTSFVDFLDVLAFVFFPWSAINMVDFYILHRGKYDVPSLYTPHGRYGGWQPLPIFCYLVGVGIEALFVSQSYYTGPMVSVVGGNDISWILGFFVPLVMYWSLATTIGHKHASLTAPAPDSSLDDASVAVAMSADSAAPSASRDT